MSEWYVKSFGEDYLLVYQHRDYTGAAREVHAMSQWLNLQAGARVLDLCCGMGRHSLALEQLGYELTGVDLSQALLDTAREADTERRVRWIKGDMRQVPLAEQFDAVVNLFTSFGYFDEDEQNVRVLREIDRLLLPEGRFLIDYLNPSYVRHNLVPASERMCGDTRVMEARKIEDGFVRKHIRIVGGDGRVRDYMEQVRLYELADFERMLDGHTALAIDRVYGAYDGSAYCRTESPRIIMIGTKRGEPS